MDDMAAYYPPAAGGYHNQQYPYGYPPPPPGVAQQPPPAAPQLQHHLPQHYFPAYATPTTYPPAGSYDEVRTLFIAGLPEDVKPREIYNLFREFPGYESSHLRHPTERTQPFGFAVFLDQQSALAALHTLNGMVFDLEKGSTLFIDLAKSNSRSKRSRIDDEKHGSEKRSKGSSAFSRGISDTGVGSVHLPGMGNSAYNMIGYPPTQSHGHVDGYATTAAKSLRCPACTEEELNQVITRSRGFLKLKMQSTYGSPVAFVDFQDTASSSEALIQLQGTVLYSSQAGEGMLLEFAKSRMGMRSKKSR